MASTPSPIEAPPPSYEIAQLNLDQKLAVAAERSLNISQQRRERERDDCPEERDEASDEAHQADVSRNSEHRAASGQIDGQRSAVRPLKFRKKSRGSKDDSSLSTKDKERPNWFEEAHLRSSASDSSASGRLLPAPRGTREHNSRTSLHGLPEDSDEDRSIPPPPFAEIDNSLDGPVYERYAPSDARRRRTGRTVVLRYMGEDYTASPPSSSHTLSGAQLRHNTAPSQENSRLHHAPQHSKLDVPTVMPRPRSADPQILPPAPPRLNFDPYVAYEGTRSSVYGQILVDSRDASCDATALYSSAVAPHLSSQKSRPVAPKVKRYTPSISSLPEYEQHQHHQAVSSSTKPVYAVQDYATSRASVYSQSSVAHIPQYPRTAQYPQMAQYQHQQTQQNYTRPTSATQPVDNQRRFRFISDGSFTLLVAVVLASHVVHATAASPPPELYSSLVAQKVSQIASNNSSPTLYPEYTDATGKWVDFIPDTWTSGFFPAMLYVLNTRVGLCNDSTLLETDWLSEARRWSSAEVPLEAQNTQGHDVGFLSFPFVQELLVDPTNQTAKDAVNAFANDLAARFDPIVGCTRSWNTSDPSDFTVVIDNMMNLNVLFVSANLTGNDTLRQIAISHADKTLVNHIREDGSSFHVVEYNETTGDVIRRGTAQGYSDDSTWSRGQSWGIYGFAQMYQNTGEQRYLDTSRQMATYFTQNVPSSGIVPWDFNAPDDGSRPADSSAAMIAASALLLLSNAEQSLSPTNTSGADLWQDLAIQLVSNTTTPFWKPDWQSLLSNGTVDNRADPPNNDTGIIYGDYYFVTVGNQLISSGLVNCSVSSNSSDTGSTPAGGSPSSDSSSSINGVPYTSMLILPLLCTVPLSLL
ncbi:hypothetical protein ACEPAH_5675 [Sanghuangporus vaninii]